MLFCGIDPADDHDDASSIDEDGQRLGSICVAHSSEGLSQLETSGTAGWSWKPGADRLHRGKRPTDS